ncbi:hypothetical protein J2Y69_002156 [Microbacterium resistens]|uniref:Uncharacterized protein n=1 Tax=Microbacterium resistens TaxID=156977 RepID=A0ABU1SD62_9MICO|nr:hypothetical protein [Microbacterium resistens]MDR6867552.1 hypothetical protein [Microbacterium resistens]
MIDYVHADDMPPLPPEAIVCSLRGPDRTAWMDDDIDPDDESLWDS